MIFEHDDILSQVIYHLDYISIRNLSLTCNYLQNKMPEIISLSMALTNSFYMPPSTSVEWDKWDCTHNISENHKNLAIASGDAYAVFFSSPDSKPSPKEQAFAQDEFASIEDFFKYNQDLNELEA